MQKVGLGFHVTCRRRAEFDDHDALPAPLRYRVPERRRVRFRFHTDASVGKSSTNAAYPSLLGPSCLT